MMDDDMQKDDAMTGEEETTDMDTEEAMEVAAPEEEETEM